MKAIYSKMPIVSGILMGQELLVLFVLFEYFLVQAGISECGLIVDACIRVAFGIIALLLIKMIYRERFTRLFTAKIPKSTWLYCIPFFLYVAVEFMYLPISDHLTTAYVSYFWLVCVSQLVTGFWEEAASKGLVMSGMLSKWEYTVKGRIAMTLITGFLFGMLHILNVLFNNDIMYCLWNSLYSSAFGVFLAAIYLHSKNITFCMVLHTVWDIVVNIPGNFCEGIHEGAVLNFIHVSQDILQLGIFPIVAIIICILKEKDYKSGFLEDVG